MKFIYKEYYFTLSLFNLVKHGFESFLKFASVLSACNERTHIQRKDGFIFESVRYVASDDSLSKTFGYCGFTYAGFADKNGVILTLTRKYSYYASYFGISADNRIKFLFSCAFDKVCAVFCKHVVSIFGIIACYGRGLDFCKLIGKALFGYAVLLAYSLYGVSALGKQSEHNMFDRDKLVFKLRRHLFGKSEYCGNFSRRIKFGISRTRNLRQSFDFGVKFSENSSDNIGISVFLSDTVDKRSDKSAVGRQQRIHEMFGCKRLILFITCKVLCVIYGFNRFLSKFFCVHIYFSFRKIIQSLMCKSYYYGAFIEIRRVHIRQRLRIRTAYTGFHHFIHKAYVIRNSL